MLYGAFHRQKSWNWSFLLLRGQKKNKNNNTSKAFKPKPLCFPDIYCIVKTAVQINWREKNLNLHPVYAFETKKIKFIGNLRGGKSVNAARRINSTKGTANEWNTQVMLFPGNGRNRQGFHDIWVEFSLSVMLALHLHGKIFIWCLLTFKIEARNYCV